MSFRSQGILRKAVLAISVVLTISGCKPRNIPKREIISFKPIYGISYTEVYRRLTNGLSFSEYGYQLEPQWKLTFLANDSAQIYSPIKKRLINFPLSRGYDSVFNTARTWYKMRKMTKDSLVMEILKLSGDSLDLTGNKVFMTFYADKYITNVLHTDSATLRRPSRRDTAYIRSLVAKSTENPGNAFAARQPVQLISTSPKVTVKKQVTEPDILNHFDVSDDYMNPQYFIVIDKAYENFNYSFSAYVDEKGNMTFGKPLVAFTGKGYEDAYVRHAKDLLSGYLRYYLRVKPGTTLGMAHLSEISLNVKGRKEN